MKLTLTECEKKYHCKLYEKSDILQYFKFENGDILYIKKHMFHQYYQDILENYYKNFIREEKLKRIFSVETEIYK